MLKKNHMALWRYLTPLTGALLLGCGGGASPSGNEDDPDAADRAKAAATVATEDEACTRLTPFYWEIGDANGKLASGQGGTASGTAVEATTELTLASASKWVSATLLVQNLSLSDFSTDFFRGMQMGSGYTDFGQCIFGETVQGCLERGSNATITTDHLDKFVYGGGHMQYAATQLGWANDDRNDLNTALQALPGRSLSELSYGTVQLAGGMAGSATGYAKFLRNMLNNEYAMSALLGQFSVCTRTGADCPKAVFSPVNQSSPNVSAHDISDEAWHYSLGHWVEDDPSVGDGAFSSPGAYGFYPWIDASKKWYGVLAREDRDTSTQVPYFQSVLCGRKIRAAWLRSEV